MLIKSDQTEASRELIDLDKYLHVVKKHWLKVAIFSGVVAVISAIATMSMTPIYKATATLKIEDTPNAVVSIEQIVGIDSSKQDYHKTQYEVLKSDRIAQMVMLNLSANNKAPTNTEQKTEPSLKEKAKELAYLLPFIEDKSPKLMESQLLELKNQAALKEFKAGMVIAPIKETHLVNISYYSENPIAAVKTANGIGEAYIQNFVETQMGANQQASQWINTRILELQSQLSSSETKLAEFMSREQLIDDEGIDTLAKNELNSLSKQLADVRDRRIAAEALYSALGENKDINIKELYSINQVSNHPQIRDIRRSIIDTEKALFEMSKRYGPKHDKRIRAKAQLRSLQNRSYSILKEMVGGIQKEFTTVAEQEKVLEQQLIEKKGAFQLVSSKQTEFDALTREVEANKGLYNLFLTRQKETSATSDFQLAVATFTDYAKIPLSPSKPRKALIVAASTAAAGIFGFLLAFAAYFLKNTIERRQDIEDVTGLPVLGSIPLTPELIEGIKPMGAYKNNMQFAESVRSIRTSLTIRLRRKNIKLIAVTSSLSNEGKTTTAISLAKSLSKEEKVLLIECDLREPSLAHEMNTKGAPMPGLADYIEANRPLDDCIVKDKTSGFDFMPAGQLRVIPQEVLGSKQFHQLLVQLSKQYDRIILDTPPINTVSEPMLVCALVKHCLFVVKANSTKHNQLKFALAQLKKHDVSIEGMILNFDKSNTQDALQYAEIYEQAK